MRDENAYLRDVIKLSHDPGLIPDYSNNHHSLESDEKGKAMTRDEALIQMTLRCLEAEARLRESVPLEAVQQLREEVLSRAPESLRGGYDRFFAEVVGKAGKFQ